MSSVLTKVKSELYKLIEPEVLSYVNPLTPRPFINIITSVKTSNFTIMFECDLSK